MLVYAYANILCKPLELQCTMFAQHVRTHTRVYYDNFCDLEFYPTVFSTSHQTIARDRCNLALPLYNCDECFKSKTVTRSTTLHVWSGCYCFCACTFLSVKSGHRRLVAFAWASPLKFGTLTLCSLSFSLNTAWAQALRTMSRTAMGVAKATVGVVDCPTKSAIF